MWKYLTKEEFFRTVDQTFHIISNVTKDKYFKRGWGDPRLIKNVIDLAQTAQKGKIYPQRSQIITSNIEIKELSEKQESDLKIIEAKFKSPASEFLTDEVENAHFQLVLPSKHDSNVKMPLCVHFAMTGDDGFKIRREIAKTILKDYNIASAILMNPFYGSRKPAKQRGDSLMHVSDIMVTGIAIVTEALSLIEYLKVNNHLGMFGPFGVTGISMGGHMAGLTGACNSSDKLATIPCIAPFSATPVFTTALLSHTVDWKALEAELISSKDTILSGAEFSTTPKTYMKYLFDNATDLTCFPMPESTNSIIQVSAKYDDYVPTGQTLYNHWPGSELRWVELSHVSSFALAKPSFAKAIGDAFIKLSNELPKQ